MKPVARLLERLYSDAEFADTIAQDMFPVSISKHQGEYLRRIISTVRPRTVIEIGMRYGVSSLWIQSADPAPRRHVIVDPFHHFPHPPKTLTIDRMLTRRRGVTIVDTMTSQEFLASYLTSGKGADLVFIDASQWFDSIMTDMYFVSRILRKNGRVLVRNIWSPSVRTSLMFYIRNLPYRIVGCPRLVAWGIRYLPVIGEVLLRLCVRPTDILMLRLSGSDRRPWDHFVPFA